MNRFLCLCVIAFLLRITAARAADQTAIWRGGGGNWSDATKWSTQPVVPNNSPDGPTFEAHLPSGISNAVLMDMDATIERLVIGQAGEGSGGLAILNGQTLKTTDAVFGDVRWDGVFIGGKYTGTITLDGDASAWENSDQISLGRGGAGNINIHNGGRVTTGKAIVGTYRLNGLFFAPGTGQINVSGSGSKLATGPLSIGSVSGFFRGAYGSGFLTVEDEATVDALGGIYLNRGRVALSAGTITSPETRISGGSLDGGGVIHGDVVNMSGTVAPAALSIEGVFSQSLRGTLVVDLADVLSVPDDSVLSVTDHASLGGTFRILATKSAPSVGVRTSPLIRGGSIQGTFDTLPPKRDRHGGGHVGAGVFFEGINYGETTVDAEFYQATPGDADGNGIVDFADFLAIANQFSKQGDWTTGDFDLNGTVEFTDFIILTDNFGRPNQTFVAVPEPSTVVLVAIGIVLVMLNPLRRSFAARPASMPRPVATGAAPM